MNTFLSVTLMGVVLLASSRAEESPASTLAAAPVATPPPPPPASWSLVCLPDLDWTEADVTQTVTLLHQLKPDLVISMAPCPFADMIRSLESKPTVLDQNQRAKLGAACGIPTVPLSSYADTSTWHSFGPADSETAGLVWLSSTEEDTLFNGPGDRGKELQVLANIQVRRQLAERRGDVVFLVDPSVPTPPEERWILPRPNVRYEQAVSQVTGFACLRPGSLQNEVAAIDGISPRVPVLHWIHSGPSGVEWEVLPADGGPAIQRSTPHDKNTSTSNGVVIGWPKAPPTPPVVPLWMDDYLNNNFALGSGIPANLGIWIDATIGTAMYKRGTIPGFYGRRVPSLEGGKSDAGAHGMIRSPGNLFAIGVVDFNYSGVEPEEGGDDGINVTLQDLRSDESILLYFIGIGGAWPTAATWFTDRYLITSGTSRNSILMDQIPSQTLHLFDLQSGKWFATESFAPRDNRERANVATERIAFPSDSYAGVSSWRTLWKAVEEGYHAKPEPAPFTVEEVAELAKLAKEPGLEWKHLGVWPPPETWQLVSQTKDEPEYRTINSVAGGDPYLTYTENKEGQRRYTLAIAGYPGKTEFADADPIQEVAAHADLFSTGGGCLPQLETIQRMGDDKRYLALAGTYQKPGGDESARGKWMLLVDLLRHHSWSAHW